MGRSKPQHVASNLRHVSVLLLAAGSGERLGKPGPKAFTPLAGGTLVGFSLEVLAGSAEIDSVVLVVPSSHIKRGRVLLDEAGLTSAEVVAGGPTRQESVRLGLQAVGPHADVVVCHDSARPFASAFLYERVIAALAGADGAVPVVPSADTVKRVVGGVVVGTIPREEVGLVQTPQAFVRAALTEAHERARREGIGGTDDASLLEAAGYRVVAVDGEPGNFKVTTAEDLARAELVVSEKRRGVALSEPRLG